jgi:anhydro-N-acetylmuramic acid kinase
MTTAGTSACYIGIMSGTSMDGIDGVLARFDHTGAHELLASATIDLPPTLRLTLLALNSPGEDELARAALAANDLADLYADVVDCLLDRSGYAAHEITAAGVHGQTVRHRPELGYTLQLNAPARLAERCGIDVIADFRSRDVAAGGQGAPLAPAFHAALFGSAVPRAVLNLGGIANVSLLRPGAAALGFDTGPANVLLDLWCQRHTGASYDASGQWAASGQVLPELLDHLVASEPWFGLPPPKSTGRDQFNADWLQTRLEIFGATLAPADVQATLQALTARTVAQAIRSSAPSTRELFVCGGGARNPGLLAQLARYLDMPVQPTDELGVPAQWVEAMGFAWLAYAYCRRMPVDLGAATGTNGPRRLGACYPA